jgi:DNA-directed RNA polymerase specialized sigma24 family protein
MACQQKKRNRNYGLNHEIELPIMMFLEGYSFQEIAIKLNLPVGTVKKKIFLARKELIK